MHTAAVSEDGCVYTWGGGSSGQLGLGPYETEMDKMLGLINLSPLRSHDVREPAQVLGSLKELVCIGVSCGAFHTAVVTNDAEVWTWGGGVFGQLGTGGTRDEFAPQCVGFLKSGFKIANLSCGAYHTAAVSVCHVVYTWGRGDRGQLGNGSASHSLVPAAVQGGLEGRRAKTVACGRVSTAAVTEGGSVFVWGGGCEVKAGDGSGEDSGTDSLSPVEVGGALGSVSANQVACGGEHFAVVTEQAVVFALSARGDTGRGRGVTPKPLFAPEEEEGGGGGGGGGGSFMGECHREKEGGHEEDLFKAKEEDAQQHPTPTQGDTVSSALSHPPPPRPAAVPDAPPRPFTLGEQLKTLGAFFTPNSAAAAPARALKASRAVGAVGAGKENRQ